TDPRQRWLARAAVRDRPRRLQRLSKLPANVPGPRSGPAAEEQAGRLRRPSGLTRRRARAGRGIARHLSCLVTTFVLVPKQTALRAFSKRPPDVVEPDIAGVAGALQFFVDACSRWRRSRVDVPWRRRPAL